VRRRTLLLETAGGNCLPRNDAAHSHSLVRTDAENTDGYCRFFVFLKNSQMIDDSNALLA
jgi:hypothetical protein